MRLMWLGAFLVGCFTLVAAQSVTFGLAPLFTDNMVVQRDGTMRIWGSGVRGTDVTVRATWGQQSVARVDSNGTWRASMATPRPGGPFEIMVRHGDTTVTLRNVLVGEVWLCSGQSNMEMPLEGWPPADTVMNSADEILHSANPLIRFFTVRRTFSAVPETDCTGTWVESSPSTSRSFSATAFFFGKKLQEALGVPIGLIHASWGGTAVGSWISGQSLTGIPEYEKVLQDIRASAAGWRQVSEWLHRYPVIGLSGKVGNARWTGLDFKDSACASRRFDDGEWHEMKLPAFWERTSLGNFDGVVWFRKKVAIPANWVGHDLELKLGPVDDIDITWVNGTKVGGHEKEGEWRVERVYRIPGNLVDTAEMEIAVRVIDLQGGGGIYGDSTSMSLRIVDAAESVSLAGAWKYMPVAAYLDNTFYVFGPLGNQYDTRPIFPIDVSANTPTSLYNGMIAPLVPYAIRGAIWYQGESDAGNPDRYRRLFPLLIENWRHDFAVGDFPFYYVQIAPFDYGSSTQSQFLRDVQTSTLSVKNTGMAVTLDIGNPVNIHPANKQDVGMRLARWALAKTYGKRVVCSGPVLKSVTGRKGEIVLSFDYNRGLTVRNTKTGNGFQIAGADRVFKDAKVQVRKGSLVVSSPEVKNPKAVRYAFTNTSEASLFNGEGLPAPTFRTDTWDR